MKCGNQGLAEAAAHAVWTDFTGAVVWPAALVCNVAKFLQSSMFTSSRKALDSYFPSAPDAPASPGSVLPPSTSHNFAQLHRLERKLRRDLSSLDTLLH